MVELQAECFLDLGGTLRGRRNARIEGEIVVDPLMDAGVLPTSKPDHPVFAVALTLLENAKRGHHPNKGYLMVDKLRSVIL